MSSSRPDGAAERGGDPSGSRGRRRVKTPLLLQMHATECGAACLGSVLAYFGRWAPFIELREKCGVSRDGSTAGGIYRAARHYGLECTGLQMRAQRLRGLRLPLILFWEFNHFLILEGFDRDHFFLNDPATGRRKLTGEDFERGYSGIALQFQPGPKFQPGGARLGLLDRLPVWLRGAGDALAYAAASGVLLAMVAVVSPILVGVFVDRVLGANEPWGPVLAGLLAGVGALAFGLTWLKGRWLGRLAIRVSIVAANRCLSRLLRLPVQYFSHRLVGELTARIFSIDKIARGLSDQLLAVLIEIAISAASLAVMLVYEPTLALVVLGLAVLNGAVVHLIARVRTDESHMLRREQGLFLGVGTLMLNQTDLLRMTAAEDSSFARWSGHQARELAARQRFAEISHLGTSLPGLFLLLSSAAVLTVGAIRVMDGEMTLGALVTFYLLAALFLDPVGRFVELAHERQALATDMRRLDDITDAPEDPVLTRRARETGSIATLGGRLRLAGQVELRGVTFGYTPGRPPLIKDLDLVIKPGQRVAVVGPSGSGKSTLSRLVAGIYQPWSGEILFDGRPRYEIPEEVLSRSLSMVDQEVVLFSATVRENLTLWNPAVPDDNVVAAARDARIHDEILSRPHGYGTEVDENGGNFSGGQRQRLEIARALVGNPTLLILDEATSALDAATEEYVDDALRRRGISCLIVAHRLSTVRDCDEIIVLEKGLEAQRGTHDELIADTEGAYSRLVRAG